jgi:hypothetical protein
MPSALSLTRSAAASARSAIELEESFIVILYSGVVCDP